MTDVTIENEAAFAYATAALELVQRLVLIACLASAVATQDLNPWLQATLNHQAATGGALPHRIAV